MNLLLSPVLANIYYIGGGLGPIVVIVLVVLMFRRLLKWSNKTPYGVRAAESSGRCCLSYPR